MEKARTVLATVSLAEYPKGQVHVAMNKKLGILQVVLETEKAPADANA